MDCFLATLELQPIENKETLEKRSHSKPPSKALIMANLLKIKE